MARRVAVERGIEVERAAGHDEAVEQVEIGLGELDLVRQGERQAARARDRAAVVLADRVPGQLAVAAGRLGIEGQADAGAGDRG